MKKPSFYFFFILLSLLNPHTSSNVFRLFDKEIYENSGADIIRIMNYYKWITNSIYEKRFHEKWNRAKSSCLLMKRLQMNDGW